MKVGISIICAVVFILAAAGQGHGFEKGRVLPYIIQMPEGENAVIVEKKNQMFYIVSFFEQQLVVRLEVPCSTGEISGVKQRAGDKKTPEGIYFLKDEYEDKYLSAVYGKKAFPIDYPNFLDKRDGRNGSAIWIHGTNKALKPMDSNGCVALENSNIVKLPGYVTLDSTPVILVETIEYLDDDTGLSKIQKQLDQLLDNWLDALENGTYHQYLGQYSPDYLPDISFWDDFRGLRRQAKEKRIGWGLSNRDVGYYYHNGIYVALFEQVLKIEESRLSLGKRKLFIADYSGDLKIIGDVFQVLPQEFELEKAPVVTAMRNVLEPQIEEKMIVATLEKWLSAWSRGDMKAYSTFYADNFYSDRMNKTQWVKRKRYLSRKYDYIKVTGNSYEVTRDKNKCTVHFFQRYESSGFTAKGIKSLKLIKKGGSWKIYQESWKKK